MLAEEAWPYIAQHVAMAAEKSEGVFFACLAVFALLAILHNSVDAQGGKLGSIITKSLFRQNGMKPSLLACCVRSGRFYLN